MVRTRMAARPHLHFAAALAFALAVAALGACASGSATIPADLGYEELVQRAQEASDAYRHADALDYYGAALERFGSNPAVEVACDYEIAFLQYKMGDYVESATGLQAVIDRYDAPDGSTLPPQYRVLAAKVLPQVLEHVAGGGE